MSKYCVVLTTVGNSDDANKIINSVLNSKLAACIQTTNIGSHYIWKSEVCHDQEILILFKTSWELYDNLESRIKELHPYDTPEILALDIERGVQEYFDWIDEVTK